MNLQNIYNRILTGNPVLSNEEIEYINNLSKRVISNGKIEEKDLKEVLLVLQISNALYNNGANLVINDNLYDGLVNLCKVQNIPAPIGAPNINFNIQEEKYDLLNNKDEGPLQVVQVVPNREEYMFYPSLTTNSTFPRKEDFIYHEDNTLIKKKSRNVSHKYDMCGTLDKCKYVLNVDAQREGAFYDHSVQIFEKDFLGLYCQQGILNPSYIELILELKYDGISIEAEVQGSKIISACTRGDTTNNEAADLTPIFGGLEFSRAKGIVSDSEIFGIKFECIITKRNLENIYYKFKKSYVNPRNAVIGLMGGLDARKYKDYVTLVPLESSLNIPRVQEIEFLNKYYSKDVTMRYAVVKGDYSQVLFMTNQFTKEANDLRDYMDFTYDGVVAEINNENIRKALGKRGAVPRYAIAIKFDPMKKKSIFTHYTYSVGQDGRITPMAHFKPVVFFGATHTKTTVHSLKRFRDLNLRSGDKILLTLVNDVIIYLRKLPPDEQPENNREPEQFPTTCPSCGQPLMESDTGDSAFCVNFYCPERCIARVTNMLKKLNIKDFSSETIRKLNIRNIRELYNQPLKKLQDTIGNINANKFIEKMNQLKNCNYPDYRLLGSLGFTGVAAETWKIILSQASLQYILENQNDIKNLTHIKGIGDKTIEVITNEFPFFLDDIKFIISNFPNIQYTDHNIANKPQVRFSGVRDGNLELLFNEKGFDCKGGTSVTSKTYMLIVPYIGYESTNVRKAFKYISKKYNMIYGGSGTIINYNNLSMANGIEPYVVTLDQAYEFINNFKS